MQVIYSRESVLSIAKKCLVRHSGFVTVAQFTLSAAIIVADI